MFVGVVEGKIVLKDEWSGVLTRAGSQLDQFGTKMRRRGDDLANLGSRLTRTITLPLVAAGGGAIKFAADFESSFAGVRKTVDATEQEFAQLSQGFRDLAKEIPVNVNELNRIGEAAGQLGIQTGNILEFTRVVADLGVTTNLSTDQAATGLARLANITGLSQDKFSNLGSSIVALGNNFATTEAEILDFGLRIAGAGEIAGLTESEILGIGAAMTSVGVQAEAGGTAVQKVLLGMVEAVAAGGEELETFAKTAGQSAEDFAASFREDAAGAFAAFVEGLGRQGDKAFKTLEDLNLTDQRLIRSFLSLAGAGDLLSRAMAEGNVAFAENTALAKEAEKRYQTFWSELTKVWNRLKDVGIILGSTLLPLLRDALDASEPFIRALAKMAEKFADLPGPIKLLALGWGGFMALLGPSLIVIGNAVITIGALSKAVGGLSLSLKGLKVALAGLGVTASILAGLAVFAKAVSDQTKAISEETAVLVQETGDLGERISAIKEEIDELSKIPLKQMGAQQIDHIRALKKALAELETQGALTVKEIDRFNTEGVIDDLQWDAAQEAIADAAAGMRSFGDALGDPDLVSDGESVKQLLERIRRESEYLRDATKDPFRIQIEVDPLPTGGGGLGGRFVAGDFFFGDFDQWAEEMGAELEELMAKAGDNAGAAFAVGVERATGDSWEVWRNFLEGAQRSFAETISNMLHGNLGSWSDFFNSIYDLFVDLLSQMAAKALTSKIAFNVLGGGQGGGAFGSAETFGTGARLFQGAGGLGGLKGIGSVFSGNAFGGGVTGGLAAAGAWILAFYAVYKLADSLLDRQKLKRTIGTLEFAVNNARATGLTLSKQSGLYDDISKGFAAMRSAVDEIEAITGGIIETLPKIEINIKGNNRIWAHVGGVLLGEFESLSEAIDAALTEALKQADLVGANAAFVAVLQNSMATSLDELKAQLQLAAEFVAAEVGAVVTSIQGSFAQLSLKVEEARRLGIPEDLISNFIGETVQQLISGFIGVDLYPEFVNVEAALAELEDRLISLGVPAGQVSRYLDDARFALETFNQSLELDILQRVVRAWEKVPALAEKAQLLQAKIDQARYLVELKILEIQLKSFGLWENFASEMRQAAKWAEDFSNFLPEGFDPGDTTFTVGDSFGGGIFGENTAAVDDLDSSVTAGFDAQIDALAQINDSLAQGFDALDVTSGDDAVVSAVNNTTDVSGTGLDALKREMEESRDHADSGFAQVVGAIQGLQRQAVRQV